MRTPEFEQLKDKIKLLEQEIQAHNEIVKQKDEKFIKMKQELEEKMDKEKQTKDLLICNLKNRIDFLKIDVEELSKENDQLRTTITENSAIFEIEIRNLIEDNNILSEECNRLKRERDILIMNHKIGNHRTFLLV